MYIDVQHHIKHLFGTSLIIDAQKYPIIDPEKSRCKLAGLNQKGNPLTLSLTDELFSKHLLFLGNIGTGKTNAISQIIRQIKSSLTENDLMVIFDTKGDFYQDFFESGRDVVITNQNNRFKGASNFWNLFAELKAGDPSTIKEYCREIAANLFADKVKKSNAPFFPLAAQDLFATFLETVLAKLDEGMHSNLEMMEFFETSDKAGLQSFFQNYNQSRVASYIANDSGEQAGGIIAELQQLLGEVFSGDFRKEGNLSIRELVRNKGGKTIFLEYDISMGQVLTPVYRLLFDLAIKETLSSSHRNQPIGNVWFFIDEFSLLPNLRYLDNGINFGRSQGAKFIIGLQNIPQAYHEYGEHQAQSILSGIRTSFTFHVDDLKSREFVQQRYGFSQKKVSYADAHGKSVVSVNPMKVIEDWDFVAMETGTAIVGPPEGDPFIFKFAHK